MMNLILWEAKEALMPTDKEAHGKLVMSMLESVKKSVNSGELKIWGVSAGGGRGFAIMEHDVKRIYATAVTTQPYIDMKAATADILVVLAAVGIGVRCEYNRYDSVIF